MDLSFISFAEARAEGDIVDPLVATSSLFFPTVVIKRFGTDPFSLAIVDTPSPSFHSGAFFHNIILPSISQSNANST